MKRKVKISRRNSLVPAMINRHSGNTKMRHRCARRQKDEGRIRQEFDY